MCKGNKVHKVRSIAVFEFGVWRLAFGVWRLAFGVWRLARLKQFHLPIIGNNIFINFAPSQIWN